MKSFLSKLDSRLTKIFESTEDYSWKDINNPDYDRQIAENALYNTVGPLTNNPRWMPHWDGDEPVPGFVPGGRAPQWTKAEVMVACAGDPSYMFQSGNPRSPSYGDRGGAPLLRMAKRIARKSNRFNPDFVSELYSNGLVELSRRCEPGYDESRSPFIRWLFGTGRDGSSGILLPFMQSAMEAGIGSSKRARAAIGALNNLIAAKNSRVSQAIADSIGPKYQTTRSYEKLEGNTYDQFSPEIYAAAVKTSQVLDSGDQDAIEQNRAELEQLKERMNDDMEMIPGAATGLGQAITNKDRKTKMNIQSADAEHGRDSEGATIGATLSAYDDSDEVEESSAAQATVYKIIDYAMQYDFSKMLPASSKYLVEGVNGKLTINELRYYVRYHGIRSYPGKGTPRKDVTNIRDGRAPWCNYGEDPELEPLPDGKIWKSIWLREGQPEIKQTAIAKEMTDEVIEFESLGIKTGRVVKQKAKNAEAISKVSVDKQLKNASEKILVASRIVQDEMGNLDESTKATLRGHGIALLEDMTPIDRAIFIEGCRVINKYAVKLVLESFTAKLI